MLGYILNHYDDAFSTDSAVQDNWEPALEKLVASIGKKFSTAFDREQLHDYIHVVCANVHMLVQVLAALEKSASADTRTLTNGPSIF